MFYDAPSISLAEKTAPGHLASCAQPRTRARPNSSAQVLEPREPRASCHGAASPAAIAHLGVTGHPPIERVAPERRLFPHGYYFIPETR